MMISYDLKDLTVLPPEAVIFQIEGIASRLGPSTVELALPLNAAKRPKLSLAALAGDQVVFQDGIQLPCSPLRAALGGYEQLLPKVLADPRGQFRRQPADDWVGFAIVILEIRRLSLLHIICAHDIWLSWKNIHAGRLEKMHVQALLAREMMVCSAVYYSCIGFYALHLQIICDIINDIMNKSMISYMIFTWMLCLFNFPAYIDCNVGYRIPSSQAPASPSLSIEETATDSSATSPSSCAASARSASSDRRYCRWPSRENVPEVQ